MLIFWFKMLIHSILCNFTNERNCQCFENVFTLRFRARNQKKDSVNCRLQVRILLRSDRKSTAFLFCYVFTLTQWRKKKKPYVEISTSVLVVNVQLSTCSNHSVDLTLLNMDVIAQ